MNDLTRLDYETLSLLLDGPAPLSVLYPEIRRAYPEARIVSIGQFIAQLQSLDDEGFISARGWLPTNEFFDLQAVAPEIINRYETDPSLSDTARQIVDAADVWVELTPAGRARFELLAKTRRST